MFKDYGLAGSEAQVEAVRTWSARFGWGFTEGDFADALKRANSLPAADESSASVPVLVPYLNDVWVTFDQLWRILFERERAQLSENIVAQPNHLRLAPGIAHAPGLRWELIAIQAHYGKRPSEVRGPNSAHAGVLAAAAHLPGWTSLIGKKDHPEAVLAGYELNPEGDLDSDWPAVPELTRPGLMRRHLALTVIRVDAPNPYHLASPEILATA
jgi:hypothetical protein